MSKENSFKAKSDARSELILENVSKRLLWTSNDCINVIRDDVVITPQLDKSDKLILTYGLDNGVVVTVV